jgi:uncharacterized coiled-coil protein SlyX
LKYKIKMKKEKSRLAGLYAFRARWALQGCVRLGRLCLPRITLPIFLQPWSHTARTFGTFSAGGFVTQRSETFLRNLLNALLPNRAAPVLGRVLKVYEGPGKTKYSCDVRVIKAGSLEDTDQDIAETPINSIWAGQKKCGVYALPQANHVVIVEQGSEPTRLSSKLTRQGSELTRLSSELTRQGSELTRLSSELTRQGSELTRLSSELTRQGSELTRLSSELTRQGSELTRLSSELIRLSSELTRQGSELTRLSSELIRLSSELTRQGSELTRLSSELTRQGSELTRLSSELIRLSSELTRLSSELTRQGSELTHQGSGPRRTRYSIIELTLYSGRSGIDNRYRNGSVRGIITARGD